jgi:hypothetical protein
MLIILTFSKVCVKRFTVYIALIFAQISSQTFGTLYNFPMFFSEFYPKQPIFSILTALPSQKLPTQKGR